mmetsp:Transcript_33325/g.72770  ORF Transcript_33325/g.72770 Transcript_33325/m.72770 type:complete len:535 (+) Transcript_33325:57-1661(+)
MGHQLQARMTPCVPPRQAGDVLNAEVPSHGPRQPLHADGVQAPAEQRPCPLRSATAPGSIGEACVPSLGPDAGAGREGCPAVAPARNEGQGNSDLRTQGHSFGRAAPKVPAGALPVGVPEAGFPRPVQEEAAPSPSRFGGLRSLLRKIVRSSRHRSPSASGRAANGADLRGQAQAAAVVASVPDRAQRRPAGFPWNSASRWAGARRAPSEDFLAQLQFAREARDLEVALQRSLEQGTANSSSSRILPVTAPRPGGPGQAASSVAPAGVTREGLGLAAQNPASNRGAPAGSARFPANAPRSRGPRGPRQWRSVDGSVDGSFDDEDTLMSRIPAHSGPERAEAGEPWHQHRYSPSGHVADGPSSAFAVRQGGRVQELMARILADSMRERGEERWESRDVGTPSASAHAASLRGPHRQETAAAVRTLRRGSFPGAFPHERFQASMEGALAGERGLQEAIEQSKRAHLMSELPREKFCRNRHKEMIECELCLMDYEEGDELMRLPCLHIFHCECLTPWLQKSYTCPVCQTDVCKAVGL